jgi:hypothetical protein
MGAPDRMQRMARGSLLLICPLLACSDDTLELQPGATSSGEDTMGPVSLDPSVDDTGPSNETSASSGELGSSSGDSVGSSSGDSHSSSSGESVGSSSGDSGDSHSSSSGDSGGPGCGDDHQDPGEECDGTDLAAYDCVTLGPDFTDGTLACAPDCTFDTSTCWTCGNGVMEGQEACDGTDLGGLGCADIGGGLTGGVLGCDAACAHDTTACTNVPWPAAGEVVITEISDSSTYIPMDWFEVYNPSPDTSFQLGGCTVDSTDDAGFDIDVDLVIGPGEYRVFTADSTYDPGFVADLRWKIPGLRFSSWEDHLSVVCNDVLVDGVYWSDKDASTLPFGHYSASLDPGSYDAVANNVDANWCESITPYASHHNGLGTPRYTNPVCDIGPVDYLIDSCRLQLPDVIIEDQGNEVTVLGRLRIAGLTDLSIVGDPAQQVMGHVGYGPVGTDPAVDATWTWEAAFPNPGYDAVSPGYEADHDEYHASVSLPGPGTYDYAYRFSGDGGTTFTHCDGQPAGSTDGYQPGNAGHMTSNPAVVPSLYFSEYVEGLNEDQALEIYNPTAEAADIDACELHVYHNGSLVAYSNIDLAGSIAAGDVLVVCTRSVGDGSFCDVFSPVYFFRGDDAVELECSGITLDVIGQIGFDPGTEWLVGGVGTQEETLRRSCSVTAGDSNGADVFDPSLEWATFPMDIYADLGQYVCP